MKKQLKKLKKILRRISKQPSALAAFRLFKKSLTILTVASLLFVNMSYLAIEAPSAYQNWLRNKVGSATVMIKNMAGTSGGTGFHIVLPRKIDGKEVTVIATNAHVCGLADSNGNVKVKSSLDESDAFLVRKVIRASDITDMCVIEPMPDITGLRLGVEPKIGDKVTVFGHPGLIPLVDRSGYITARSTPEVMVDVIGSDTDREACKKPKNKIVMVPSFFGMVELCLIQVPSYETSINGYPGNSGSPVVDGMGRVVSVLYAGTRFNFAVLLDFKSVRQFLTDGK